MPLILDLVNATLVCHFLDLYTNTHKPDPAQISPPDKKRNLVVETCKTMNSIIAQEL